MHAIYHLLCLGVPPAVLCCAACCPLLFPRLSPAVPPAVSCCTPCCAPCLPLLSPAVPPAVPCCAPWCVPCFPLASTAQVACQARLISYSAGRHQGIGGCMLNGVGGKWPPRWHRLGRQPPATASGRHTGSQDSSPNRQAHRRRGLQLANGSQLALCTWQTEVEQAAVVHLGHGGGLCRGKKRDRAGGGVPDAMQQAEGRRRPWPSTEGAPASHLRGHMCGPLAWRV